MSASRSGRRPGESGTREAIADAARRLFAERGYDRTTIRAIASAARVDPALVGHYFGSKHELFLAVAELPFDPEIVLPMLLGGDRNEIGARLATFVTTMLEEEGARTHILVIVRAAASEPAAAAAVRELLTRRTLGPLAAGLGVIDAELRATLVGSQIVGLVMARYVVGLEPLASLPREELAAAIAPTLQRYLTEPLA